MSVISDYSYRPVWAEIHIGRLRHNLREVRRLVGPGVAIFAVVKADAYGHGAIEAARAFLGAGADYLAVSLPEEGIMLRQAGFDVPILVFGPYFPGQGEAFTRYGLIPSLASWEALADLSGWVETASVRIPVHVKIDTGMSRVGVQPEEALRFLEAVTSKPGFDLQGVYTHLARADETDKTFALRQHEIFTGVLGQAQQAGIRIPIRHMANSAGIIDLPQTHLDAVRPGIMLYGLYPSDEVDHERVRLEPAMELKARVSHVKEVAPGTAISYGGTYRAGGPSVIATIPAGYADGYSRMLNGRGARILINGRPYPVAGRICMDQTMVDAGSDRIAIGDEAVLFGKQGESFVSADEIARRLGTINYEVTCMVSRRVPRIYKQEVE